MTSVRLNFTDDGIGVAKHVEFEADTPASALSHLQSERCGRRAELVVDGKNVGHLTRCSKTSDFWIVEPPER
jgi:hypothetical protein